MSSSGAEKEKILVVEDETTIREVCQRTLMSQGYPVDMASNGAAAKDMIKEENYDLIVIDIKTPIINGKQLFEYIKETYPKLADRVVFTTGDVMSNDIQYFLEQSGRQFLLKPFTPDELSAVVREALSRLH